MRNWEKNSRKGKNSQREEKTQQNVDERIGICFLSSVKGLDHADGKIRYCSSTCRLTSTDSAFCREAAEKCPVSEDLMRNWC